MAPPKLDGPVILILTNPVDPHSDEVVAELTKRQLFVLRVHPENLLADCKLVCQQSSDEPLSGNLVVSALRELDLADIGVVYFRHPNKVKPPAVVQDVGVAAFLSRESTFNWNALLSALNCPWVTHPDVLSRAESKVLQLKLAASAGLRIPLTLWTNSRQQLIDFCDRVPGDVVVKAIDDVVYTNKGVPHSVFTSVLRREDLAVSRSDPTLMLGIYQERIAKNCDLRVTVVGDQVFATEIRLPRAARAEPDWRNTAELAEYRPFELPIDIQRGLKAVMRDLGIQFGAIDMLLTPEGEYVFLECNPNGQWLWIERATGQPITSAVASLLATLSRD